ncbi:hypothetical protein AAGS61_01845 [Lysinibacillus sp. KU-BSD001]|uniref:hypothetical protein n=1 Tax=Lysinibacillus sp. KU-BSD001 TaxID=3141328 RepID=UPI0036E8DD7D
MELLVVTGAGIAEKVANSSNPWIYLSIVLIFAALFAGRYIFNYLVQLDQSHREESKEREKALMSHLERSNESQERTAHALEGINISLSTLEGRVDRIEKHAYKKESA